MEDIAAFPGSFRAMEYYTAVCYYLSSHKPSRKIVSEFTLNGAVQEAKEYFTTWGLNIQRIELYLLGETKIIHCEEIHPAGTPEISVKCLLRNSKNVRRRLLHA